MAEEVRIPFVGDFSEISKGLTELRDLTAQLRDATQANSKAIQSDAQKNVAATESVNKALEETLAVTSALNKEGLGSFTKGVDGAEKSVDAFADTSDKASKATDGLNTNLDQTEKEFKQVGASAAQAGKTATDSLKRTEVAAKGTDRTLSGLGGRFRSAFSSVGTFLGNAGRSIANVGANLKAGIIDRLRGVAQGFSAVGSTAVAALGPIGIAAVAVGGALTAIGSNIDSVTTKFDGFRRTGGILFDELTGAIRSFFTSLTDGETVVGKVFGTVYDGIALVLKPLTVLVEKVGELTGITQFLEDANSAGQELAAMYDAIDAAQTQNIAKNAVLDRQINKLNIQLRDRTKSEQERVAIAKELDKLEKQRLKNELDILAQETKAIQRQVDLRRESGNEEDDDLNRQLAQAQANEQRAAQESESLLERTQNRLNAILDAGVEKRRVIREKDLELSRKIAALELELRRQVLEAENVDEDPLRQAQLDKQAADIRIDALEKEIRETNRLRTGQATITKEQEDQLTTLRLAAVEAYWKKRLEIETSNAEKLFAQAEKNIALEQRLAIAQVEQRQRGAESEEEFERQKQAAILAIKIEAAKKSLELLASNTTAEGTVLRAELQALIVGLQQQLAGLAPKADKKEFSIYRLLGLDPTPEEKRAIEQSINSALTAVQQAIAAEEAQVQAHIAATDRIIADRERRSQDLQSRLANEIALAQAGFASNVDLIRQQIAAEDAAAEAEKARRAQLIADQQRLAKQQLAIDAVVQASALATAAAKVFSAEAPKGIIGILSAIGVLASMIAAFASIKARAKAISAEQFEDGGHVGGRRHSQGGTLIEAERGEYVTRRGATAKWGPVLEGINEGAWTRQRQAALVELLDSANVKLSPDMTDKFVGQKETLVGQNFTLKADNARLEKKVTALTEEVKGMRRDGHVKTGKEGDFTVTRKPGRTTKKHG